MAYEVVKAADYANQEDQIYRITTSLHEAKRVGEDLIKKGYECYIMDSDTPDEWNWAEDKWEQVR